VTYDQPNLEYLNKLNISVPISAAISSYSRVVMSHYLHKYRDNIYAMDTDGIKVDCKLDPSEIDSKEIGKMKYEYTFKKAIFPAPKVYGGIVDGQYKGRSEIVKLKGVKVPISYAQLCTTLNKNSCLSIQQEK
jgi:hypothetical protein